MRNTDSLEHCVLWACRQEVSAPKPGNVNCFSDGHNMQIVDFLKSAEAIAPILCQTELPVGDMILAAVKATRRVVNCNTNLGIVLLFAPLCKAFQQCDSFEQLPKALENILINLTIDDAIQCYKAIRLAEAGGLGNSENHDIHETPTVTLRQVMDYAKNRDSIAAQYLNNYQDIFQIGLTHLTSAINCGESVEWACAFAYLNLLSSIPDTLVHRKYGLDCAESLMEDSALFLKKVNKNTKLNNFKADIIEWDKELKKKAINPGTTADMTAAALLVYAFEQTLSKTVFQNHETG